MLLLLIVDVSKRRNYTWPMATVDPNDPFEAADAPLRDEEARLLTALEAIRASRAAIASARSASAARYIPTELVKREQPTMAATPLVASEKFNGKGLGGAAVVQLAENRGLELTVKQCVGGHVSGRLPYPFRATRGRPQLGLAQARERTRRRDSCRQRKMGLTEWYSPAQIKEIKETRTNASGRNHIEHVEKTKAGIANAMSSRLTKWGRRPVITAEQMAKAYYARKSGMANSKLATAKAGNTVFPTFCSYWKQFELGIGSREMPSPRHVEQSEENRISKLEDMSPPDEQSDLLKGNRTVAGSTVPH